MVVSWIFLVMGIEFSFADTSNPDDVKSHVKENTKLFLTETPANPTMKISDISAISEIAKSANAVHVVDNTLITPCFQRAIELGADLSLHSTTKYFDGHNATVGGVVVAKTKELDDQVVLYHLSIFALLHYPLHIKKLNDYHCLTLQMDRRPKQQ